MAASLVGFFALQQSAQSAARDDAEAHAELLAVQIKSSVSRVRAYVAGLRTFVAGGGRLTAERFSGFAAQTLGTADLYRVAWVQPVPARERPRYERALGRPITQPGRGGRLVRATARGEYFPATFVASVLPGFNRGVDLSATPGLRQVLRSSEVLFGVTVSRPVRLSAGQEGVFFVQAAPRRSGKMSVAGLAVVFVPTTWLASSLAGSPGGFEIRIDDAVTGRVTRAGSKTPSRSFTAATRRWRVVVPGPRVTGSAAVLPWLVLAGGAAVALLVALVGAGTATRRQAREELDRIFALSRDLISVAGFDGYLKRVNPSFAATLGYSAAELLSRPYMEWVHPDDRERTAAEAAGLAAGEESVAFENRYRCADGSYRWLEWTARSVPQEQVIYAVARDVTERKQAEEQREALAAELRQSQKLEAVGLLAGGVAHDFNNLLTAIIGYCELALPQAAEQDRSLHDHVHEIRQAARRAEALTRQLLAFSRRRPLETTVLDLNEVVSEVDRLLRRLIGANVELVTLLCPEPVWVMGDVGLLEQVLVNLAVNARDAMPDGGKLVIETARARVDGAPVPSLEPGPYALLSVLDTGIGMTTDTQAHIFEPFFTTKEVGKGTGLGLSTAWGAVEQLGGRIVVDSEPGKGTRFAIYLPETAGTPLEPPSPEPTGMAGGARSVLLVEDEDSIRRVLVRVLGAEGYEVVSARYASEALDLWERHRGEFDVLVCDVVMPGMSGVELAERLAERRPEMAIILMSGFANPAVVEGRELTPAATFLAKPFTPADLLRTVAEALARRRGAASSGRVGGD